MKRVTLPPAWRYVVIGLAVSAAAAFSIVNMASANPRPEAPEMRGPGGFGAPGMGLPFAGPGMDRMLDHLQATEAQREQLHRIAEAARTDLQPTAEAGRADHARMAELFAQPTVDPAAVEALRKQMLARHDQVTKRINVAMLDAAKVLTVEQRQQMVEEMKQRAEHHAQRRAERAEGMPADAPKR